MRTIKNSKVLRVLMAFVLVVSMLPVAGLSGVFAARTDAWAEQPNTKAKTQSEVSDEQKAFEAVDVEAAGVQSMQDYILQNARRDLVGEGNSLTGKDYISTSTMIVDGAQLPNATFETLWNMDADGDGQSDNAGALVNQGEMYNLLYSVNDNADYVVGRVAQTIDGAKITDWAAAFNNTQAQMIDDIIFDASTGLVYVPKQYMYMLGDNTRNVFSMRIQLIYTTDSTYTNASVKFPVEVNADGVSGSIVNTGTAASATTNVDTQIKLACNNQALQTITTDTIDSVEINGIKLDAEADFWTYDTDTGVLSFEVAPVSIMNVKINLSDTWIKSFKNLFVEKASAAPDQGNLEVAGSVQFNSTPDIGDWWEVNAYTGYFWASDDYWAASNSEKNSALHGRFTMPAIVADDFANAYKTSNDPQAYVITWGEPEGKIKKVTLKTRDDYGNVHDTEDIMYTLVGLGCGKPNDNPAGAAQWYDGYSNNGVTGTLIQQITNGQEYKEENLVALAQFSPSRIESSDYNKEGSLVGTYLSRGACIKSGWEGLDCISNGVEQSTKGTGNNIKFLTNGGTENAGDEKVAGDFKGSTILALVCSHISASDRTNSQLGYQLYNDSGTGEGEPIKGWNTDTLDPSSLGAVRVHVKSVDTVNKYVILGITTSASNGQNGSGFFKFTYSVPTSYIDLRKNSANPEITGYDESSAYNADGTVNGSACGYSYDGTDATKDDLYFTDANGCYSRAGACYEVWQSDDGINIKGTSPIATFKTDEYGWGYITGCDGVNAWKFNGDDRKLAVIANKNYLVQERTSAQTNPFTGEHYTQATGYAVHTGFYGTGGAGYNAEDGDMNDYCMKDGNGGDSTRLEIGSSSGNTVYDPVTKQKIAVNKVQSGASMAGHIVWASQCKENNTTHVACYDTPQNDPISIKVQKVDATTGEAVAQGNGSLAGAVFKVSYYTTTKDTDTEAEKAIASATPERTWYWTTNASGFIYCSSDEPLNNSDYNSSALYHKLNNEVSFPVGTYAIEEVAAPEGYRLPDTNSVQVRQIKQEDTSSETVTAVTYGAVEEPTINGGVKINKQDTETGTAQGNASLAGIKFDIVNKSKAAVTVDGKTAQPGEVVMTIETDASGIAQTGSDVLPYGDYEIAEVATNGSYLLDSTQVKEFSIVNKGEVVDLTSEPFKNDVVRGGLKFDKLDSETKTPWAMGSGKLNATFEVVNKSENAVEVDGTKYATDAVVATVQAEKTDDGWHFESANDWLPYGKYEISEVEAADNYVLFEGAKEFSIATNGVVVDLADTESGTFEDTAVRADVAWEKVNEELGTLANVPFLITNTETGEQHVAVTDLEGKFNSSSSREVITGFEAGGSASVGMDENGNAVVTDGSGSSNVKKASGRGTVNANDAALTGTDYDSWKIDETKLDYSNAVWFGLNEAGVMSEANDKLGAFYKGTYEIKELPCSANAGYQMIETTIEITDADNATTKDYGQLFDLKANIETVAYDAMSKDESDKVLAADAGSVVADKVSLTNLVAGREYTLKSELHNAETGELLGDAVTQTFSVDGTAESVQAKELTVEMPYDTSNWEQTGNITVYEYLSWKDYALAEEAEAGLESQTVQVEVPVVPDTPAVAAAESAKTSDTLKNAMLVLGGIALVALVAGGIAFGRKKASKR